ncbi:Rab-GTPase-TBC domain [Ostreococcus tauri]|uniref:Rab-GTPase-TBC domain n=1 Tax=Ostreococcus tauri TaxID=70448 RepID=A0A090M7Y0_OSTTA|nr:Rab-GTPase-TBC domain [Ostreococcus tauri]CEF98807.1 Rab-GTPase-TBC domain [Ostreococcus tauri]|eukprot:XP_022839478.1 Rab-GTPase-TBC domain [Ostreococcus tauri]
MCPSPASVPARDAALVSGGGDVSSSPWRLGFPDDEKSRDFWTSLRASDARLTRKWENFTASGRDVGRRGELTRAFARQNGLGGDGRRALWVQWSGARTKRARDGDGGYGGRLERSNEVENGGDVRECFEQIDLDLPRTFPEHERFREPNGDALAPLRRILRAFAMDKGASGYVQGMNYLAGFFLMVYGVDAAGEEDAYWTLRCVVEDLFPGYFEPGLKALRADLDELDRRYSIVSPEAHAKLESMGLPVKYFTARWLMCGLIGCAATPTVLRVWDLVFVDSDKQPRETLMRCSLAMLALQAPFMCAAEDMNSCVACIREAGWMVDNIDAYLHRVSALREQTFPITSRNRTAATPSRKRRYEPPPTPARAAMTPVGNTIYASLVSFFSPTPSKQSVPAPASTRTTGMAPKRLWSFEDKPLRKTPPTSGFRRIDDENGAETDEIEMSTPKRKRVKESSNAYATSPLFAKSPLGVKKKRTPMKSPRKSPLSVRL